MAIKEHPPIGTVLICDFQTDFRLPEMVKVRPVIVISPKIFGRPGLCTVVALSTTPPDPKMPFHAEISIVPKLPPPWDAEKVWVKGAMSMLSGSTVWISSDSARTFRANGCTDLRPFHQIS